MNGWIRHTKWYVPGVVKSIWLDICQDIESIDVGPSPTPYERAEELAAVAYGAGRTWFQGEGPLIARPPAEQEHQTVVPIREAFLGHGESVAVDEAIGRISCESIAGYPPGVPALLPGERITEEVVAYLRELTAAGARLHGAADPSFGTIPVLVCDPSADQPPGTESGPAKL